MIVIIIENRDLKTEKCYLFLKQKVYVYNYLLTWMKISFIIFKAIKNNYLSKKKILKPHTNNKL